MAAAYRIAHGINETNLKAPVPLRCPARMSKKMLPPLEGGNRCLAESLLKIRAQKAVPRVRN